jgi:probable phosphoglycerate mutase
MLREAAAMSDRGFVFGSTPFYFVRHGQTHENEREIVQGQGDTKLNKLGLDSAERSAEKLQTVQIASIYTSPLRRAWQTAMIINAVINAPVHPLPGLMERHWGIYQGRPKAHRPREVNPDTVEAIESFTDRVLEAMSTIKGPTPVLVVAHSGVFRVLCGHAGLSADLAVSISSGEPVCFDPAGNGRSTWHISMV